MTILELPGEKMTDTTAFVALGSNNTPEGCSPADMLSRALSALNDIAPITAISRFWRNPAFPKGSGPDFVNAAAAVTWSDGAAALLAALKRIESDLGRVTAERWGPRAIDLDLIAMGDSVLPDRATFDQWQALPLAAQKTQTPAELILPHPRLQDRAFVLVPLAEIAPDWVHPVSRQTIRALRDACPTEDLAEMVVLRPRVSA